MRIDAIIPAYNGERYIGEAIESVLAQDTRHAVELTVVDDGSTDATAGVVREFGERVRYLAKAHSGVGATRNHGVRHTSNPFIAFLDADDLWTPDKTELQAAALLDDPALEAVFGQSIQFLSPELAPSDHARRRINPAPQDLYLSSTILIRRAALRRVGEHDPALKVGAEIDWTIRAREAKLRALCLPRVVHRRRVHDANHSLRSRPARADYARLLKRALDRRRGTSGG